MNKKRGKNIIAKRRGKKKIESWRWMLKSDSLPPPTEHEEILFHMYAMKTLLQKLAWVATLHPRHTAMMISFDRFLSRAFRMTGIRHELIVQK